MERKPCARWFSATQAKSATPPQLRNDQYSRAACRYPAVVDGNTLVALIATPLALIAGAIKFSGRAARMRARAEHDLKILALIPDGEAGEATDTARTALRAHISHTIETYTAWEAHQDGRRTDWTGVILALFFIAISLFGAWTVHERGLPWVVALLLYLVLALVAVFGIVGLQSSIRTRPSADGAQGSTADG